MNLEDLVKNIVEEWMVVGKLFTALDVSLKVRKTYPFARHRKTREAVREYYQQMQSKGYGRTPIDVTLEDGSITQALLYHPLSDSWDLEEKYDQQKREVSTHTTTDLRSDSTTDAKQPAQKEEKSDYKPQVHVTANVPVTVSAPQVYVASGTSVVVGDPTVAWDKLFADVHLFPTK